MNIPDGAVIITDALTLQRWIRDAVAEAAKEVVDAVKTSSLDQLLDIHEAARLLRKAPRTLYRDASEGRIPAHKIPGVGLRFIRAELIAHIQSGSDNGSSKRAEGREKES